MKSKNKVCKLELQMELNKRMYERGRITPELYHRVSGMLIKEQNQQRRSV